MNKTPGRVFAKNTIIPGLRVGEATAEYNGKMFSFSLAHTLNREPYITCNETGKKFLLPWEDILDLAGFAGITTSENNQQIQEQNNETNP